MLGTFGIPLFLAVNGYLMYDRKITPSYFKKKFVRYFRFVFLWSVVLGLLESIVKRRFMFIEIFIGAWLGQGRLFHFWFITALLLLLAVCCIVNVLIKRAGHEIQEFVNGKTIFIIILLMSFSFFADGFMMFKYKTAIRDVILAPLRLITNGGYFFIGMWLHQKVISHSQRRDIILAVVSYVGICLLSAFSVWSWGSGFYPCIFCVIGTVAILEFCMNLSLDNHGRFWKAVQYIAPTSIGIWIFHPFVLAVLRKMLELLGFSLTLPLRVIMVPLVFVICMIVAKIALKIKGIQMLFKI